MNTTESEDGSVGPLREALTVCAAAGMSGILRVTGNPGGAIHITDGLVAAVETPGAPGPEALLLRSHRVSESGWDEAFAAAAASGALMGAELARRELIGAGELEWLLLTALADGMFALASGTVEEYRAEPGPVEFVLPLRPGAEPDSLLTETTRRIRVLATMPARNGRDRIVAATGAVQPGARLGDGQDEILALADGRRTARDIAFALGRGVYATMLQLSRMQRTGLLVAVSSQAADAAAAQARRPVARNDAPLASALPRRQRDVPGASRRPWAPSLPQELRAPLGLLRTRAARDTSPGETS
ncbi:MAG TPA: hypothetical protein VGI96_08400 [Streptosporangiaceae bacterium]